MTAACWLAFFDPPRSLSSAMEDRTYGILELLSLQGQQNLQADLITWIASPTEMGSSKLKIFVIIMYIDILNYMVSPAERERNRDQSMWLQVSTKAVNAIRTVTAVASCHPNFHDTFLGCISGYIKMWHPTIERQVGLDQFIFFAYHHSGLWLQNGGDLRRCRGAAQVGDLCLPGSTGWVTSEGGDAHSKPPLLRGQMSILRVIFWELHWPRIFFFKTTFWLCGCVLFVILCHATGEETDRTWKKESLWPFQGQLHNGLFRCTLWSKNTGPHGPSGSTGSASFTIVCGHCFTPFAQKWTLQGCLGAGEGPGPQDWIWVWLFEKRNQRKVTRWNLLQIVLFIVHPSPCFLFHDVFLHQGWDTPGFIPMSRVSLQVGEGIGHRRTVWESFADWTPSLDNIGSHANA